MPSSFHIQLTIDEMDKVIRVLKTLYVLLIIFWLRIPCRLGHTGGIVRNRNIMKILFTLTITNYLDICSHPKTTVYQCSKFLTFAKQVISLLMYICDWNIFKTLLFIIIINCRAKESIYFNRIWLVHNITNVLKKVLVGTARQSQLWYPYKIQRHRIIICCFFYFSIRLPCSLLLILKCDLCVKCTIIQNVCV